MRTRSRTTKARAISSSTNVSPAPTSAQSAGQTTTLDNGIPISIDTAALLQRITELEDIVSTLLAWIKEKLPDSVNDDTLRGIIQRFITPNHIGLFNSELKSKPQVGPRLKRHKPQTVAGSRTCSDAEVDEFSHSAVASPNEPSIHYEASLLPIQGTGSGARLNDSEDILIKVEPYDDFMMEMHGEIHMDQLQNTAAYDGADMDTPSTSQVSAEADHTCAHCAKVFQSEAVLARHLKVFHSSNPKVHICAVCGKIFADANTLEDHIVFQSHGQAKNKHRLQCTFCFRSYKNPEALEKHTQVHLSKSQSEKCRCPICGNMLCDKGTVRAHIREVHRGVRKYKCTLCPKTFKKASHLKCHKESHERLAAKLKEIKAKGPKLIKKKIVPKTPCTCQLCGKTFSYQGGLSRHMLVRHTPNANRHMCSYCGLAFPLQSGLKNHMKIHTDDRPYQCKYCPSKFKQRQGLRCHEQIHLSSAKPNKGQHRCPICGNILGSKTTLREHIQRVHEGVRRYPCHICPLRFKISSHLKQHLAAHAKGARPRPLGKPGRKVRPGGFRLLAQVDPASVGAEQEPPVVTAEASGE